ncbi:MAG TPA: ABC transporter permease, partial [Candidatus Acidoferrales bacterium]|nr:ABC transporter permease [Candidatus Acidoferrales bacterium]
MFQRKRNASDFGAEIEAHIQLETERLREQGLSERDARAAAHRAFGNVTHAQEHFYESGRWLWWDQLRQDVRYGLRALLRERGVSTLCVLILALGIGASTALYSVWQAALVFPYEFESSGRWVAVLAGFNRQQTRSWFFSIPEYNDLRQLGDIFESASVLQHIMFNLTDNGHPESLDVTAVSADAIRNTGVQPLLGRSFLPGEDAPGGPNVVLISYSLWQGRYLGDRNILGRQIRMNEENYSVIGVMPPYFLMWGTQLWVPLHIDYNERNRSHRAYWVTAMLKKGVSQKQADARLAVIAHHWEQQNASQAPEYANLRLWTEDVIRYVTTDLKDAMLVLLVAIALLLIITCSNVTNILLARVTARRREVAIRLAMGGGRIRIIRQFLTESVLLAVTSGALGLLIARESLPLIRRLVIDYVSTEAREFRFDFSAFLFVAALSVLVGLLYGVAPAIQASKTSVTDTLKEGGRAGASRRGQWWRKTLVVTQVGLALVVVASASLMTQSYRRLSNSNLGFNPAHVLATNIALPEISYPGIPQTLAFYQELQQSVSAIPGVEATGVVSSLPVADRLDRQDFHVEGRAANSGDSAGGAACRFATPGYFRALQISLASGRLFTDEDRDGRQLVAIVNETLAKRFWPNESAVGKRIALGNQYSERIVSSSAPSVFASATSAPRWITIIGVFHDTRQVQEWGVTILPEIYLPYAQATTPLRGVRLVVRSLRSPSQLVESVRQAASRLDSSLPLGDTETMEGIVRDAYGTERLALVLLTIFAVVALILAVAGVYALLSYNVSQQAHEIGIRMALGALPREILALVLQAGARLALLGVVAGVVGGVFLTRLMTRLLYQVSASDPVIF